MGDDAKHQDLILLVTRFRLDKEAAGAVNVPPEDAPPPAPPAAGAPAKPAPAAGAAEDMAAKKQKFVDEQIKKVAAGGTPNFSDDAEAFPHWHIDAKVLTDAEEQKYPKRLEASRKTNYKPPPPPEPTRTTYGYSDPNDPINTGGLGTDFEVKPGPVRATTLYMNDAELERWVLWLKDNEPALYEEHKFDLTKRIFHRFYDDWQRGRKERQEAEEKAQKEADAKAAEEERKKMWPPDWELTEEELFKRGQKGLFQREWQYYVAKGWVTPFVQRLKTDDEIVKKVKAARAMLPKVEFGKGKRMQWVVVGDNGGWMYTTDPKDPYLTWLFQQWAKPWLDATVEGGVPMLSKMAAMATMFQEAHPSSINTYDGCVFSYGIGFAIGAPQIVCEIVKNPIVRKVLYLSGIHITPGPPVGGTYNTYDIQLVDFTEDDKPLIQVWDNRHHWYGFSDGARTTVAPSGKGGKSADAYDSFKVETDNAGVAKKEGDPSKANLGDGPMSSSELTWNAYRHLSNKAGKDMEVLSAFIALAEDELTRATVNEVNQRRITARATVPDSVCKMYTEAGYTFLSMCVHNWALPIMKPSAKADGAAAIWLADLIPTKSMTPYLREDDARAVRSLRAILGQRPAPATSKITFGKQPGDLANMASPPSGMLLTDAARDAFVQRGPPADTNAWWELAEVHDAIVAKAIARLVMSLLEWNRWTSGMKQWASKAAKGSTAPVTMDDEQVRSYNWGWRFKRLRAYWLRMTNGYNYFNPLVSVVKGSGIDVNQTGDDGKPLWPHADALLAPHGVRYMKFDDFDISDAAVATIGPDNFVAIRGDEWGDGVGQTAVTLFDLGRRAFFNLPAVMTQYGRRFTIISATVDSYGNPTGATVRLDVTGQTTAVDRLGMVGTTTIGPTIAEPEPAWPSELHAPNFMATW